MKTEAAEFVRLTPLPDFVDDPTIELTTPALDQPDFAAPDLAVTVGSQIAYFTAAVAPDLRQAIANTFLFAQQAADKRIEGKDDASSTDWYDAYADVLSQIGWTTEDRTKTERQVSGTAAHVNKVIIPIITAALAPVAAATPIIVQLLQGLQQMDENQPWITLFNQKSQRARANQFQIAAIDVAGSVPRIRLVAFELDAQRSVAQVLFFRFTTDSANLSHFQAQLSANDQMVREMAPLILERIADRIRRYIGAIPV